MEPLLMSAIFFGTLLLALIATYVTKMSGTGGFIPSSEIMVLFRNGTLKPMQDRLLRDSRGGFFDMKTLSRVYPQ